MAIDYAALAEKHGGKVASSTAPDYAALASKHGGSLVDAEGVDSQSSPKGVFGQVEKSQQPKGESWWDSYKNKAEKVHNAYQGFHTGVAKGVASTISGVASLGEKAATRAEQAIFGDVSKERLEGPTLGEQAQKKYFTPEGTAEQIGFGAEQIGEFFIPTGAAGKLSKVAEGSKILSKAPKVVKTAAGIVTKAGAEGLETLARTSAQHGAVDEEAINSAKLSGGLSALGSTVDAAKSAVGSKMGGRIMNSLIKPGKRDFAYGKNPGKTLAEEGIVASNLDDLATGVNTKREEIGTRIGESLKGKTVKVANPLTPIDEAIQEAAKGGPQNANLVKRLRDARDSIQFEHSIDDAGEIVKGVQRDFSAMTGEAARDVKGLIGSMSKWTENPSDDEILNKTLQKVYGKFKGAMERAAPEVKALNQKYADLLSASSALSNRIKTQERLNMVGLGTKVLGGTALVSAFEGGNINFENLLKGAGIAGLNAIAGSPAAKTRVAAWLSSTPPADRERLLSKVPGAIDVISRILKGE